MAYDEKYLAFLDEAETIKTRHKEEIAALNRRIRAWRDKCEHDWVYHPDASGNNDSSWSCSKCEEWTNYNPHKAKKKEIHKLTGNERNLTVIQCDEKFGVNGWK